MCKVCKRMICPPTCPNFESNDRSARILRCASCGKALRRGDGFYQKNGFPYCEDCLELADTDTLVRICETQKQTWLEQMGFAHKTV